MVIKYLYRWTISFYDLFSLINFNSVLNGRLTINGIFLLNAQFFSERSIPLFLSHRTSIIELHGAKFGHDELIELGSISKQH